MSRAGWLAVFAALAVAALVFGFVLGWTLDELLWR